MRNHQSGSTLRRGAQGPRRGVAPVWAKKRGITVGSIAELANHPLVLQEVQRAVDAANEHLGRVDQIERFRILPEEWTPLSGELTPALKMKRRVVVEKYVRERRFVFKPDPGQLRRVAIGA